MMTCMARDTTKWNQINLLIPPGLHRQLRLLAAVNQRSMNAEIRRLVQQAVNKELGLRDR